jgi:hypothetical protein
MAIRGEVIALGLAVGLGSGVGYAVHEVGTLNERANQIEACLQAPPQ